MAGDKPEINVEVGEASAPGDLGELLRLIEAEPVPERLLVLAMELQRALATQRLAVEAVTTIPPHARRAVARV